ncbi:hypothetical protein AAVH_42124 [Aphelenchoides avenae]|nr:hypothetical protein AAVH_42124 [Aphelenchus avenae]
MAPVISKLCVIALVIALMACGEALICYETTDDGYAQAVENANWTYCAVIPALVREDGSYRPGRAFGVDPDTDTTTMYEESFKPQIHFVKTLSFCIMERYDWGLLYRRASERPPPEFLFRCVCNRDRCNDPNHYNGFLPRGLIPLDDLPVGDVLHKHF